MGQKGACHRCGEFGHFARDGKCGGKAGGKSYYKGRGGNNYSKGKGGNNYSKGGVGGKDYSKGSGKGGEGLRNCYSCGQPGHFAR